MAVGPDRTQLAFISVDAGGAAEVYSAALSSVQNQPRPLRPAGSDQTRLLAWLP